MELRPHPIRTTLINPVALLLGFIFLALLSNEYCGDQLKSSFDETSFVSRHINLTVCWKWKQIEAIPIFFNRLKSGFFLVWSL